MPFSINNKHDLKKHYFSSKQKKMQSTNHYPSKKLQFSFFNIIKYKENGAALIEYTLIGSLIVIMLMAGYKSVGSGYTRIYNNISNAI